MRSAEYERFGPAEVVAIRERPVPVPEPGEVLVRVRAAALNPKDVLVRSGKFRWLSGTHFPRQLGYDFAGEVCGRGRGVRHVREGDAVFGMLNAWRGGTVAEFCCVPESELSAKPAALSWEEAAALPLTGLTALQALRDDGQLRAGQRLFIHGASGGVGVAAVQLGKAFGAHVTSVCSAHNRELVMALGSDEQRSYEEGDLFGGGARYDVIFDVFGNQSFAWAAPALNPRGRYVTTVPALRNFVDSARTQLSRKRARLVVVNSNRADLLQLASLIEAGKLRAVVHQVYDLADIVAAQRQIQSKHTRGKVVVRI